MSQEYKDIFQSSHGAKLGFQSPFFLVLTLELFSTAGFFLRFRDQYYK